MDSDERRKHPRLSIKSAVMVAPNGRQHAASVVDLSAGGARLAVSGDWMPNTGARLRVFFLLDPDEVLVLESHVVHQGLGLAGVHFDPDQETAIARLLGAYGAETGE